MIERGSGRTSGITDWHLMSVDSMWACLQNQDTAGQWKQVAGWRKISDLALTHLGRLREYRRGLAAAWPPETNAAARAYLGELDQLIDKAQRTHDAAAANYDALAAATRAIGSARAELKPIRDEYAAKLQQKQSYEEIAADPKAAAGSRMPDRPPVTDADLEELNKRARALMSGVSGELQQAQAMLRQPPTIRRPGIETNNPDIYGTSSQPPIVPPIVPVPLPKREPTAVPRSSRASMIPAATSIAPGVGPVLGGTSPTLTVPPAPAAPTVTPPPPMPSPINGAGPLPPLPAISTPQQAKPMNPHSERFGPVGKEKADGLSHTTPPRSIQPIGLIGGTPGIGMGQPGARAIPPRRVNPVGGVIGGGGAGTSPTGAAGSRPSAGRSQLAAAHGGPPFGGYPVIGNTSSTHPSGKRGSNGQPPLEDSRHWDPDDPWEVDEGVSPVVYPPGEDGPIDPGPAIGLDR
jgi:hypothetical protein